MNTQRSSTFSDFVAFLIVVIPLAWLFAVVGFGGLADQRRMSKLKREALAAEPSSGKTATSKLAKNTPASRSTPKSPKPLAIRIHEGKQVYEVNCVTCHQPGGTGKIGLAPDIHNPDFLALASDEFLEQTIRQGRPATAMAPWAHLTDDQIDGIIAYLRSLSTKVKGAIGVNPTKEYAGEADAGEPLFNAYCASCHGPQGEGYIAGGVGPGIGLEGFLSVASDDYIVQTLKAGRRGTPMKSFMGPSGLANLSEEEVGHIIAYLRAPSEPPPESVAADQTHVPDPVNGEAQFNINCAACHQQGGTGKAGFAPSIRNRDFLALASDDFIKQTIKDGRSGTSMVARPDLSDAIVADIIAYLRAIEVPIPITVKLDPDKSYHGDSHAGGDKYMLYCASCHGNEGNGYIAGGSGPAIGLPGFLAAASDDYIYHTLKIGRVGTAMRPFLGARGLANLTDQDAYDIINYLRSLNP